MNTTEKFIKRCLELAEKGKGKTEPNPYVGCILVKDHQIVAEGYHEYFGGPHAEVNAIQRLPDDILPQECDLFVNLEPCSHFGKTPPCCDLIIQKKFRKVWIGTKDPNPLVSGKGIEKLRQNGIQTEVGFLEKECYHLNRKFFFYHQHHRPFITLKWAQTADGFISLSAPSSREQNTISHPDSLKYVHQMRAEHTAILVGKNTILADNPRLTVRHVRGKNPLRIVMGYSENMQGMHILKQEEAPTVFFCSSEEEQKRIPEGFPSFIIHRENFSEDINKVCRLLQIQSILAEGGRKILDMFLKNGCWNELIVITSNEKYFHHGIPAPEIPASARIVKKQKIATDEWTWYENEKNSLQTFSSDE